MAELQAVSSPDFKLNERSLFLYSCGRVSEIWNRPEGLYSVIPSKRLLQLAEPRRCSETYLQQRPRSSPQWPVSVSALSCKASQRILALSQPRCLHPLFVLPKEVSLAAQQAVASPRIAELAKAKALPFGALPDRAMEWPVSTAAKHAVATPRLEELAQPPKRAPTNFVQFDPEAFTVKESAKKAICSERIKQLAQPVQHSDV